MAKDAHRFVHSLFSFASEEVHTGQDCYQAPLMLLRGILPTKKNQNMKINGTQYGGMNPLAVFHFKYEAADNT